MKMLSKKVQMRIRLKQMKFYITFSLIHQFNNRPLPNLIKMQHFLVNTQETTSECHHHYEIY